MNKCNIIIWLLISYCFLPQVKAQSLEELILLSIENNLEIKILENEYRTALERVPQVRQNPDPELGLGVFPLPVQTRVGPQIMRLSASQVFPWFGTLKGRESFETARAESLREKMNVKALELAYQIKQSYFELYEIKQTQNILQENFELLSALEKLALAKVESGKGSIADALSVQLRKEELIQKINILESKEAKPRISINELLNRNLEKEINMVERFDFVELTYSKDSLLANISDTHPMFKMFELQQEVSRKAIELNRLNAKPSFAVGMDYIMVGNRNDVTLPQNGRDIVQLKASVSIPFKKGKYKAKKEEEQLKIIGLEIGKEQLLAQIQAAIERGYADFATASITKEGYSKQIKIIQSTINVLETQYSATGKNFDELLQLEMKLIEYDLKVFDAIMDSHYARNDIEKFLIPEFPERDF